VGLVAKVEDNVLVEFAKDVGGENDADAIVHLGPLLLVPLNIIVN
jgi:hypothetical protein